MLNNKVKKYLDSLEKELKILMFPREEHQIARKVTDILNQEKNYKPTKEDKAELIAFELEVYHQDVDEQKIRYEAMFSFSGKEGQGIVPLSIKAINQDTLKYWAKRARESKNPILSSMYADVVVYLSRKVLKKDADIDLYHIVIDSNITICEHSLVAAFDCKTKATRASVLAITIKDKKRIAKIEDTIIKMEKNIETCDTSKWGGLAIRMLLLDYHKRITIEDKEIRELVNKAEVRLKRVATDPILTKDTVHLLAEYYKSKKDEENLIRVLNILENSLKSYELSNSDALSKLSNYECMYGMYKKYQNNFPKAIKESERLLQEIGQLDLYYDKSWIKPSFVIKTEKDIIDDYLEAIFGRDHKSKLEIIMCKIANYHLPKKAALKKHLGYALSKHPEKFSSPKTIFSEHLMPIARFHSIESGNDSHLMLHASLCFQFVECGVFLPYTTDKLRKQFSKEKITEYFENSLVFKNENNDYLKRAISAYFDEDYLVSSHLFIPLIESKIRELVRICGGKITQRNKKLNGSDYRALGRLLSNIEIKKILDVNTLFYLRLVLTEKLGWNLRNDLAHGLEEKKFSLRETSDRLFHILILLSLVKKTESE